MRRGVRDAGAAIMNLDLATARDVRAVVLVEGRSDQAALEAVARRRGLRLGSERIAIVPMGGATNIGHFLRALGPDGRDLRLAGLCDSGEERHFRHALASAGLGADLTRSQMEALGFGVCVADLEDELIRALGAPGVEAVIEAEGDIGSWRTFQNQPAQRDRSQQQQLHRFMGTRSGRKGLYARLLVEAVDPSRMPRPLDAVITFCFERSGRPQRG
jgi:hypothetical protein